MYFKFYSDETREWKVANTLLLQGIYILIMKAFRPQEYMWIEKISLCEAVSFDVLKEVQRQKELK